MKINVIGENISQDEINKLVEKLKGELKNVS